MFNPPPQLAKGDQSTASGSSFAGTATPMETEEEEDLEALEKAVEAEFNKDTPPLPEPVLPYPPHPSQVLPPPAEIPATPSPTPKTPTPSRTMMSPPPSDVSGNLARALVGGGGLMPSQLFCPDLEKDVTDSLNKLTEEEFDKRLEEAKTHPEFKSYCDGMRLEIGETGDESDAWVFGDQEPFLDMVGFLVWVKARENMRKALGVVVPPPPPAAPAIVPTPHTMFFDQAGNPVQGPPQETVAAPKASAPVIAAPVAPKASSPPEAPKASAPVIPAPEAPKAAALEAPKASAPVTAEPEAPKAPPPSVPSPSALSAAVDQVVASTATPKPTSTSHRKEYMTFLRAANNP